MTCFGTVNLRMAAPSRNLPFALPARPVRTLLIRGEDSLLDVSMLELAGYDLYTVAGPEAAIRNFSFARPRLVLIDLYPTALDNKRAIQRLRERTTVPFVVLSSSNDGVEKICSLDLGPVDFLVKPIGTGELLIRLRASLRPPARSGQPLLLGGTRVQQSPERIDRFLRRGQL
jgi:two-component system KDP operon response regulator KdpE